MTQIPFPLTGRPLYVNFKGGKIYISAHDAFHLERERGFKRLIGAVPPARNHRNWVADSTHRLLQARARWENAEARWYALFGLDPPGSGFDTAARQE